MTQEELTEYLETHYLVVVELERLLNAKHLYLTPYYRTFGRGGMWGLAKAITDLFQEEYQHKVWDGEWEDEVYRFVIQYANDVRG